MFYLPNVDVLKVICKACKILWGIKVYLAVVKFSPPPPHSLSSITIENSNYAHNKPDTERLTIVNSLFGG